MLKILNIITVPYILMYAECRKTYSDLCYTCKE